MPTEYTQALQAPKREQPLEAMNKKPMEHLKTDSVENTQTHK